MASVDFEHLIPAFKRSEAQYFDREKFRDLRYEDPGKDVSAYISRNSHELVRIWMGDVSLSEAMSKVRITVPGDGVICQRFKSWFPLSTAAQVPRP